MNTSNTIISTDLWLAGCKGQPLSPSQQSSNHYAEGSLIRSLFYGRVHAQNEQIDLPTPTELSEQRHWQQILKRTRQEGIFASTAKPSPQNLLHAGWGRFKTIASNQQWFAIAASVAVLGIGLTLFMQQHDNTADDSAVIMRGDEATQRLTVQANQTAAQVAGQIEAVLQLHQLPYRRTELNNGGVQIQCKVPKHSPSRQMLLTLGLSVPEHERLNVLVLNP
jgi:hypothetical protein